MTETRITAPLERTRSSNDFRRRRQIQRNVRLHQQIKDLVGAYTKAKYFGINRMLEHIAANLGFAPHDLCIVDVTIGKRLIAIICVPHGGWKSPSFMGRARDLRHRARQLGYQAILVPQGIVERQPRLGNASIIGAAHRRVLVDDTSRMQILEHLVENGDTAIGILASSISHRDPYGAVLHLVAAGILQIDLRRSISPVALVGLAEPSLDLDEA